MKLFIENSTIRSIFNKSVKKYKNNVFLSYAKHNLNSSATSYTYLDVQRKVKEYTNFFLKKKLQELDRISVIVGNIPEFFIIKLALNCNNLSCVPLNYELSNNELSYIIKHSSSKLIITNDLYLEKIKTIIDSNKIKIGLVVLRNKKLISILETKRIKRDKFVKLKPSSEASLIYTSGTTGKPKGCILSHFYEINAGYSYVIKKGLVSIREQKEKIYNCLPVHHVNAGILSFYAVLLTGNCQIQAERFSASSFWKEINYSKATIFHYLGLMAPILLKRKKSNYEKIINLKCGIGAGIEPRLHQKFEKRFKVPMIELWGMTEMVRCIFDNSKNRKIGERCFGRPDESLQTLVVDENGNNKLNEKGELLIRHNAIYPQKGFFDGYYKNKRATESAWRNKWFHTGDIVIKNNKGYLFFVDRKKNLIRRGGENISSAEIEANLLELPLVKSAAVCGYPHHIYEEEVFAMIVLINKKKNTLKTAKDILKLLSKNLTYFKLPGIIKFTENIPVTSTQKIVKSNLLENINIQNKNNFYDLSKFKKNFK